MPHAAPPGIPAPLLQALFRGLLPPFLMAFTTALLATTTARTLSLLASSQATGLQPRPALLLLAQAALASSPILPPIAFLVALLVLFHRLAADGTLLGLQTLGYPPSSLRRPLLTIAALPALASLLAGWLLEPPAREALRHAAQSLEAQSLLARLEPADSLPLPGGITAFRPLEGPGMLFLQTPPDQPPRLLFARQLASHWRPRTQTLLLSLHQGQLLIPQNDGSRLQLAFDTTHLELPLNSLLPRPEVADLSPEALLERIHRAQHRGLPAFPERAVLARKLAIPLSSWAWTILFLAWLPRSGTRRPARPWILAASLVFLYYLGLRAMEALSPATGLPPGLASQLPNLLLAGWGLGRSWRLEHPSASAPPRPPKLLPGGHP